MGTRIVWLCGSSAEVRLIPRIDDCHLIYRYAIVNGSEGLRKFNRRLRGVPLPDYINTNGTGATKAGFDLTFKDVQKRTSAEEALPPDTH